jgi:hypothetical protein
MMIILSSYKDRDGVKVFNDEYGAFFIAIYSGSELLAFGSVQPEQQCFFHCRNATHVNCWTNIKHDHIGYSIFKRVPDEQIAL